jgi:hypothetical protein
MELLAINLLLVAGAAFWLYSDYQERQKNQKLVIAVKEEITNGFPDYGAVVSQGVAASIASDIRDKKGVYRKAYEARNKLEKQRDWQEPEDSMSRRTKELTAESEFYHFKILQAFKAQLPDSLREYVQSLPPSTQREKIVAIANRAISASE